MKVSEIDNLLCILEHRGYMKKKIHLGNMCTTVSICQKQIFRNIRTDPPKAKPSSKQYAIYEQGCYTVK